MPHMIPEYVQALQCEPFYEITHEPTGESWLTEAPLPNLHSGETYLSHTSGYFARLSAPGYLDCTDWAGPFDTPDEAREHVASTYDVDPDTGEEVG